MPAWCCSTAASSNQRRVIDANIRKLGFKTEDVKLIVNSHGHYDHAGGIAALQRASGATVAASPSGAECAATRRKHDQTIRNSDSARPQRVSAGRRTSSVIKDNDVLRVGNVAITANFTPGHTPGSTTWTWQSACARRRANCLNMVYADSISAVSAPGFKFTAKPEVVNAFRRSITRLAELPCDIVVSTHPSATGLDAKIKKRAELKGTGPDPFVDHGCKALAAAAMKGLEARIAEEKKWWPLGSHDARRWRRSCLRIACSGPLQLANIQIGRSLNQDRSIASITTLFKPSETVYVSVQTGAPAKA